MSICKYLLDISVLSNAKARKENSQNCPFELPAKQYCKLNQLGWILIYMSAWLSKDNIGNLKSLLCFGLSIYSGVYFFQLLVLHRQSMKDSVAHCEEKAKWQSKIAAAI